MSEDIRIVITGLGPVTPIGIAKDAFRDGLREARNGFGPVQRFDVSSLDHKCAGLITDFNPLKYLQGINVRRMALNSQFLAVATQLAISDARLDSVDGEVAPERVGLVFNTANGSMEVTRDFLMTLYTRGPAAVSPLTFAQTVANAPAAPLSIRYKLKGCSTVIMGSSSIGYGYEIIKKGQADIVLCGGTDHVTEDGFVTYSKLGLFSRSGTCRPYDRARDGLITGEGAGMVVLESAESAEKRGVKAYAELLDYTMLCDGVMNKWINQRSPDDIYHCMRLLLERTDVDPASVDLVNGLAPSMRGIDETEAVAVRRLFPNVETALTSIKGSIGETWGSGETLSVIASALMMEDGEVYPVAGLQEVDDACPADPVRGAPLQKPLRRVVTNGHHIGGNNVSILMQKYGH
ncbi:MAG: beta-ketoacyl-[acyl-carrier-protein] synthase family protein [Acidobacteria bacterium]|nr:beta-ketoacyl-[acyl-carrier-protein] synthase family protein [Acidobacteriota bacterium]